MTFYVVSIGFVIVAVHEQLYIVNSNLSSLDPNPFQQPDMKSHLMNVKDQGGPVIIALNIHTGWDNLALILCDWRRRRSPWKPT